jgi:HEPN domain-containing protein
MTPLDLARAFIKKGLEDETLLTKVQDDPDVSDDLFGFHVQQAIEKYLKAVLAITQTRPTQTHDLTVLMNEIEASGEGLTDEVRQAESWTPFAVRNRYPFMGSAPEIDRQRALVVVAAIRSWAEGVSNQQGITGKPVDPPEN